MKQLPRRKRDSLTAAKLYGGIALHRIVPNLVIAREYRLYYCYQDKKYLLEYQDERGTPVYIIDSYAPMKVGVTRVNHVDMNVDINDGTLTYRPGRAPWPILYETEEEIIRNLIRIV